MDARTLPPPLAERTAGPLVFRLLPPDHPTADLEKAVAIVGFVALAALLLLPLEALAPLGTPCRFRAFTGLPCPTCGGTRAALALARFDLPRALEMNPLLAGGALLAFALAPLGAAAWVFRWPRPRVGFRTAAARRLAVVAALGVVLLNWALLVAAGR